MMGVMKVRNPRNGEFDYEITPPSEAELDSLTAGLRQAQSSWAEVEVDARVAILQQWKQEIEAAKEEILDALTIDTGRRSVSLIELGIVTGALDRWSKQGPELMVGIESRSAIFPDVRFASHEVPYELVGVIAPWNFPLALSLLDTIPALVAGCSVIIKPSEVTPRFVVPLVKTIEAIPALHAVLCYVQGAGETGAALVDRADMICFTGSVPTGRKVAEQAARNFIPSCLELGGKDPLIIMASADLERAASATLRASINNTGQACQSIERIYVDASVINAFVDKLIEKAEKVELSYPDVTHGIVGPLIFEKQAEIIKRHLKDAVDKGAQIRTGGKVEQLGGGYWIRPTVVTDVTQDMILMREETFGPIMPIMKYDSVEQAVRLANDTDFGLSGGVIAGTVDEALAVGKRINAGAISINDAGMTALTQEAEKNSFNLSGMGGSRTGAPGFLRFFRRKALMINEGAVIPIETFEESKAG